MNEIKIDIIPISELKPYEKNARKHQIEDVVNTPYKSRKKWSETNDEVIGE